MSLRLRGARFDDKVLLMEELMTLTSAMQVFLVGTAGGVLLEVLHWYGLRRDGSLPDYARRPFYWIVSAVMALTGGALG